MVSVNDIFNRPPTISEDTLQYCLYLPQDQTDRVSATALATLMIEYTQTLLPEHLWHRDSFELKVAPDPEGDKDSWVLEGRMRVGDCIDDEWCAVWLLRELTKKWDVAASVWDSDGEFLLIEAAEELPSWVSPSNAENRVWIHNSRIHLVPLSHVSPPSSKTHRRRYLPHQGDEDEEALYENEDGEDFITAHDAVKLVRDPLARTTAPETVEQTVWKRISGYPAASRQHIHVTKAYLPADVAKAISVNPPLVQKAVEAFYTRDALQLRSAQKMARFPPEPSALAAVRMTRTAYAQLVGQKFHPPKIFGRWSEKEGSKEWRWRDVGMKIACGFEMLYQESKNRKDALSANFDGSPASMDALKDNLRRNSEYTQYIECLSAAGYFKGELQGSQQWTALENQAASAFVAARKDDDASRPSFATVVQAAIVQYTDHRGLPSGEEDSDDWLNVDAADFDAMLEKTAGSSRDKGKGRASDRMDVDAPEDEEERIAKAQAARLKDLAKQVEDFVEGEGDLEGARFADEASDAGDSDDSDDADDDDDEAMDEDDGEDEDAPHPASSPLSEEQRKARQEAMDKLVPGIDPSEYGKMPASFHSNSQRTAPVTLDTELREELPSLSGTTRIPETVPARPIRPPILPRDKYDGVDSDDETDEDEGDADEEEDDEHPQVVGEVEIDMAEEEEEFIEFARQALGVTDEQWNDILRERSERGAFVPTRGTATNKHAASTAPSPSSPPQGIDRSRVDPDPTLNSFEAVMRAMDEELARGRGERTGANASGSSASKGKGKGKAENESEDIDIEAAMASELHASLDKGDEEDGEEELDYQLIKNFLESFKSQAGMSGPVGNLVGRLQQGWTLPRDDS
ncbi:SGT1-domain-containing protein [Trametes versicolor FP-101664 SS1]|uniref:SGT1-domain-containing protein n=1 Tax=Trametes versicolor (strain FP-101664) TaxID=717944 RepID=UPI0004622B1B|nr:SGT1-domain-containing protein [Trametes versicolor FP-101664 SS1]EIW64525.1 SGT1-domain-containing protein [Trametes versicolor FP-101664 SS1]